MATFTTEQADACIVLRCDSFKTDDVHQHYVFSVQDDNNITYEWEDAVLAAGATKAQVKVAIHGHLITIEKAPAPLPVNSVDSDITIIGETVGDGSPF